MHKLNIGDLVCFNGGGMKHETLGVVLDFDFQSHRHNRTCGYILIMWSVVGKYMPRARINHHQRGPIESGQMVWHEFGDWFVEVK